MKTSRHSRILVTPTFEAAYAELSSYLRKASPLAFIALPSAMTTILATVNNHPQAWPIRRKVIGDREVAFHLAVMPIAYRRLHLRYLVDGDIAHFLAIWVDGHDEPDYFRP